MRDAARAARNGPLAGVILAAAAVVLCGCGAHPSTDALPDPSATRAGADAALLNEDNPFGRLYRLNFDPNDPTGGARPKLTLELDPGGWEFSGVVDAEEYLGRGAWILDVQAHSLRIAPEDTTVEGGQYLQVIWKPPSGATTARTR